MAYLVKDVPQGGYRYIPAVFQYSSGVAAAAGYRLERVRFARVVPLAQGFECIAAHLESIGRPLAAFAACELRSPRPVDTAGFRAFNEEYADVLRRWGIADGEDNPVARSNVCPEVDAPAQPGFHAFSYTVADNGSIPSFVIADGAETRASGTVPEDRIVEYRNVSAQGMRNKGRQTLDEMERRLAAFGFGWNDTTAVQVYTVHDFHGILIDEMARRGAARNGLTWHACRPPVLDVEFEMDCRAIDVERCLVI
ncbi:hypothetical protein GG851_10110 [Bordetella petrii]|nr:hypothetical protein [Bordetella petrii]